MLFRLTQTPPIMAQLQKEVDTALSDGSLSTNRRNHTDVYTCKTDRDRHGVLVQEVVFSARSPVNVERVAFNFLRDLILRHSNIPLLAIRDGDTPLSLIDR